MYKNQYVGSCRGHPLSQEVSEEQILLARNYWSVHYAGTFYELSINQARTD